MTNPKLELITSPAVSDPKNLLTPRDVATMLNVDISWVRNHTTRVEPYLTSVSLGGCKRYRREDIMRFIEENVTTPRKKR